MSGFAGSGVGDSNFRLRFFIIVAMGLISLGAVLYWRSQLMLSSEYVDFPITNHHQKNSKVYNKYDIDQLPN